MMIVLDNYETHKNLNWIVKKLTKDMKDTGEPPVLRRLGQR